MSGVEHPEASMSSGIWEATQRHKQCIISLVRAGMGRTHLLLHACCIPVPQRRVPLLL